MITKQKPLRSLVKNLQGLSVEKLTKWEQDKNYLEDKKMNQIVQNQPMVSAFVSCSLRKEDKQFVDFIERILRAYKILPMGTVGYYSIAPMNLAEHMRMNIPLADFVVIVATPRYLQQDLQLGEVSYGLSEMVHVETGMAYAFNKPVVVFVQEGTKIGNFLPHITEYIVLNGQTVDLRQKSKLITSLIRNTFQFIQRIRQNESATSLRKLITGGLAFYGVLKMVEGMNEKPRITHRRSKNRK